MLDVAPTKLGEPLRNAFYKHSAPLALLNRGIRQHNHMKTRRVIALVAVVKKPRRAVRGIRFGLAVFGRIIVVSRIFIALCGLVGAANGGKCHYLSRSIDGDALATARGTELKWVG